ncbi:MAG: peptidyl-prolyl cis-trans isomerase, partial [Thermoanaerobaculia bacterium]
MSTRFLALPIQLALIAGFAVVAHPAGTQAEEPTSSAIPKEVAVDKNLLAMVNDWPVYVEDLERVLSDLHSRIQASSRPDFDVDSLIRNRLVGDALLAGEAAALAMDREAPIPKRLEKLRDDMARERLEYEAITSRVEIDESLIETIFESDYRTVTAHMATLKSREEAGRFLDEIRAGADFEALARERSVDGLRGQGGLAENFPYRNLPPEIAEVVFDLEPGSLSAPLLNELGWTVFRAESFAAADPQVLPTVEDRIRGILELRQADTLRAELLAELLAKHEPEIDNEAIAAIGCERRGSEGLWPVVPDPKQILVQIQDRLIRADDLGAALLDRWRNVQNEEAALLTKPLVLDKLIAEQVILVEALAMGYGDSPDVERAQQANLTRLLVGKYLDEVILPSLEVPQEEAEQYYETHRPEFRKPPNLRIFQVTTTTLEEAEEVAQLLREGADMSWIARQRSIDRFKDSGGDRGWIKSGRAIEPFSPSELRVTEAGEILGPKGWEDNFVVLRVAAVEEQGDYSFEEVSGNVRNRLKSLKFAETMDSLLMTLRE